MTTTGQQFGASFKAMVRLATPNILNPNRSIGRYHRRSMDDSMNMSNPEKDLQLFKNHIQKGINNGDVKIIMDVTKEFNKKITKLSKANLKAQYGVLYEIHERVEFLVKNKKNLNNELDKLAKSIPGETLMQIKKELNDTTYREIYNKIINSLEEMKKREFIVSRQRTQWRQFSFVTDRAMGVQLANCYDHLRIEQKNQEIQTKRLDKLFSNEWKKYKDKQDIFKDVKKICAEMAASFERELKELSLELIYLLKILEGMYKGSREVMHDELIQDLMINKKFPKEQGEKLIKIIKELDNLIEVESEINAQVSQKIEQEAHRLI